LKARVKTNLFGHNCPSGKKVVEDLDVERVAGLARVVVGSRRIELRCLCVADDESLPALELVHNDFGRPVLIVLLDEVFADRICLALADVPGMPLVILAGGPLVKDTRATVSTHRQ
jgi:hypothetical protein